MSDEAVWAQVDSVMKVVDYAVHPDDHEQVRAELFDALRPLRLDDYGLMIGSKVRFQEGTKKTWREGVVREMNRDGSILLMDARKKFQRSFMPSALEYEGRGPRGGVVWFPVEKVES